MHGQPGGVAVVAKRSHAAVFEKISSSVLDFLDAPIQRMSSLRNGLFALPLNPLN
jgi:hypothetical protein